MDSVDICSYMYAQNTVLGMMEDATIKFASFQF